MVGIGAGGNPYLLEWGPATGQIQVEYSRNPARFALPRIARIVPVTLEQGAYSIIENDQQVRVPDVKQYRWSKGQRRPRPMNLEFGWGTYSTLRHAYGFQIPRETVKQAKWDVVAVHARGAAQLAMTARTVAAMTTLTTSGNWVASESYFATATALGAGGYGTVGNIQKIIQAGVKRVHLNTGGAIGPGEMSLVMGPETAQAWSQQSELKDYVKNYPLAYEWMRGSETFQIWGLPPMLWGCRVEVDDTVVVTTNKGASSITRGFALGANKLLFTSRQGPSTQEVSPEVGNFSTFSIFAYEDLTIEARAQEWDRLEEGSVVDNSVGAVTATRSGLYIADCSS